MKSALSGARAWVTQGGGEALGSRARRGGSCCPAWALVLQRLYQGTSTSSGSRPDGVPWPACGEQATLSTPGVCVLRGKSTGSTGTLFLFDFPNQACQRLREKALLSLLRSQRWVCRPRPLPTTWVSLFKCQTPKCPHGGYGSSGLAPPMPPSPPPGASKT